MFKKEHKVGERMLEQWTGDVVGKMHVHGVTVKQLAIHMGVRPEYLSKLLSGSRKTKNAEKMIRTALQDLLSGAEGEAQ